MIGVAFWQDIGLRDLLIVLELFGNCLQFIPGLGWSWNKLFVVIKRNGLNAVGETVQLSVVGKGFDRHRVEVFDLIAQVERCNYAVAYEVAEPVMRTDEDVRTRASRASDFDTGADITEIYLLRANWDVVLGGEVFANFGYGVNFYFIGPDGERAFCGRQESRRWAGDWRSGCGCGGLSSSLLCCELHQQQTHKCDDERCNGNFFQICSEFIQHDYSSSKRCR